MDGDLAPGHGHLSAHVYTWPPSGLEQNPLDVLGGPSSRHTPHALITFFFIFLTSDFDLRQKSFLFLESFLFCEVLSQQQPKRNGEKDLKGEN